MDETSRSTSDASNKDPAKFPYTKTPGIAGAAMAKVADMKMEIRHEASPMELSVESKIKLIDSALELIRELKLEPEKSSDEEDAYNAALGFLAIQYNDQCRVEIALPKEPPGKSVEPVVHMRAH